MARGRRRKCQVLPKVILPPIRWLTVDPGHGNIATASGVLDDCNPPYSCSMKSQEVFYCAPPSPIIE
jgi:hypothetical protein